ncbi:MAG: hypothetical protein ACR2RL_10760 [Gammaproteobacteria bacterium]
MKMLVVGLDGADRRLIDGLQMPFTQQLLREGRVWEIEEDLLSRGWAETLTGRHGSETGGLYLRPKLDGTYEFTPRFSCTSSETSALGHTSLWTLLNERGVKVGLQNVPTTGPAVRVNGFFVAGAEGRADAGAELSDSVVSPSSARTTLGKVGYVTDVRGPAQYGRLSKMLPVLETALDSQTKGFLALCREFEPSFGLACFTLSVELHYLAMVDIEAIIDDPASEKTPVRSGIVEHFRYLDGCIERLFIALEPQNYVLTSAHATAPFRREANIDAYLAHQGWLTQQNPGLALPERVLNRVVNSSRRHALKPLGIWKPRPKRWNPYSRFDRHKSVAFGNFFDSGNFAGIYINDQDRFGGPVSNQAESQRLVKEICWEINHEPSWQSTQVTAAPYRAEFAHCRFERLLPDIHLRKPDELLFYGRALSPIGYVALGRSPFVAENPNFQPLSDDISAGNYPFTGVKGRNALFCSDLQTASHADSDDPHNLTSVYRVIDRVFS